MISIIVAVAKNGVIGNGDVLPWHFPEDLAYFKEKTLGKSVVMGERTYRGIGKKLKGRKVIVLSRSGESFEGAVTAKSIKEALLLGEGEVMIAGGRSVYKQFLKLADTVYLTKISKDYIGDVYFPKIDKNDWKKVSEKRGNNKDLTYFILKKRD